MFYHLTGRSSGLKSNSVGVICFTFWLRVESNEIELGEGHVFYSMNFNLLNKNQCEKLMSLCPMEHFKRFLCERLFCYA